MSEQAEAIQSDAEAEIKKPENEPEKQELSGREKAMADLIANRESEKTDRQPVEKPEEPEEPPKEEPEEQVPVVEFVEGDKVYKVPAAAKYRGKINGEDVEETVDNVTRSFQKSNAASRRLNEATQRMKDAEAKAAELSEREKALTEKEKTFSDAMAEAETKKDEGTITDEQYREIAQGLIDGLTDEEDPVAKLTEVVKKLDAARKPPAPVKQTIDQSEIDRRIDERMETKAKADQAKQLEKERSEANDFFRENYADIAESINWMAVAKVQMESARKENPNATMKEIAKIAGDKTREVVNLAKPARPEPARTPKSASSRAAIDKSPKPQTRKDIFNELRAARGQPLL